MHAEAFFDYIIHAMMVTALQFICITQSFINLIAAGDAGPRSEAVHIQSSQVVSLAETDLGLALIEGFRMWKLKG